MQAVPQLPGASSTCPPHAWVQVNWALIIVTFISYYPWLQRLCALNMILPVQDAPRITCYMRTSSVEGDD